MSKLYLLSSVELNVRTLVDEEVFYTVDNNLNLVSIGSVKDFSKGFNADVLATLDNTVYSQLNKGKVYVSANPDSEASILSSGGALVVSDSSYAIPCTSSGIKKIQATATGDTKFAISFDNRVTWYSMTVQDTLMPGSIISSPVDVSSTGEYIITAGTLPSGTEKLVMKLGQTGDTLPVRVSIQGRMTGGSSWTNISSFFVEEITSDDFDITENITGGYDEYRIYVEKVKDIESEKIKFISDAINKVQIGSEALSVADKNMQPILEEVSDFIKTLPEQAMSATIDEAKERALQVYNEKQEELNEKTQQEVNAEAQSAE